MNIQFTFSSLLLLFFLPISGYALEVAEVNVSEQVLLANTNTPLKLNGAGVRSKFFFKIYVGALYLPQKTTNAEKAINMEGGKRILMHFLYKKVEKEKLVEGWVDGFKNNHSGEQFEALKTKLEAFNKLFDTVKRGDRIELDYLPEIGTQVSINDQIKGSIFGKVFYSALLKVWLGEDPADSDLKEAMLGK